MHPALVLSVCCSILMGSAAGAGLAPAAEPVSPVRTIAPAAPEPLSLHPARLPIVFEANRGQVPAPVRFRSRGNGFTLLLTSTDARFVLTEPASDRGAGDVADPATRVVTMRFVNATGVPAVPSAGQRGATVNYFHGRDAGEWVAAIPAYDSVRYDDVYPGIDVVFHGRNGRLEYDFLVSPFSDTNAVELGFDGADDIRLDDAGRLVIRTGDAELVQHPPGVFQDGDDGRRQLPAHYEIHQPNRVTFSIPAYETSLPLLIDPIVEYSTYLHGSGNDDGNAVAVDAEGNAYVVGYTNSPDFPTVDALQPNGLICDAFVAKLDPAGSIVYSTYLGGSSNRCGVAESALGVAVDDSGHVYLTGATNSTDFPLRNAWQATCTTAFDECEDAFLAKLDPSGSTLVYSTYIGGNDTEIGKDVALDGDGAAYVTGSTRSANFPTLNPLRAEPARSFIAKFDAQGNAVYATYFDAIIYAIAVDGQGRAHVAGQSLGEATPDAFQPQSKGHDAFAAKLNATGNALIYATHLGGSDGEMLHESADIAVDDAGNAYVVGDTESEDFPTRNAFQPVSDMTRSNDTDIFVTKINPTGRSLVYSTYLGGGLNDIAYGVAVDDEGHAHVVGESYSHDFPTRDPLQPYCSGTPKSGGSEQNCDDAIIVKLGAAGDGLIYSTFLGGDAGSDDAYDVAVGRDGSAWITGSVQSSFPFDQDTEPFVDPTGDVPVLRLTDDSPEPNPVSRPLIDVGDINGNGSTDLGLLVRDPSGSTRVHVRDSRSGTLIQSVRFADLWRPIDAAVLRDFDGNGAPEIAVLAVRRSNETRVRAEIRDSLTGRWQSSVFFGSNYVPDRLVVVPDLDGNGADELAVLGFHDDSGQYGVQVEDSLRGNRLTEIVFDAVPSRDVRDVLALPDMNGNGTPELAVLGRIDLRESNPQVEIRDAANGELVKLLKFPGWIMPRKFAVVPDANGNGVPELAFLGRGKSTVAYLRDVSSGADTGRAYFDSEADAVHMLAVDDVNGNGTPDLALLTTAYNQNLAVEIRDPVAERLIRKIYFGTLKPLQLAQLRDMTGNGYPELALLGTDRSDRGYRVIIRDSASGEPVGQIDFPVAAN